MKPIKEKNLIFGLHAVIEAIDAGKEIEKIMIRRELGGDLARELFEKIKPLQIPVQRVPAEKLNYLTQKNHQGVIAIISSIVYQHVDQIIPTLYEEGRTPFVVILDGVTDVRNFGAIARSCECAGVDALIVPSKGGAAANGDAIKTSAGALHTLPICRENNLYEAVRFLQSCGLQVVAATEKTKQNFTAVDFRVPTALVMGSEDEGISPEILCLCNASVSIPILGRISSLNVSVAAGVLLYEVVRQRMSGK